MKFDIKSHILDHAFCVIHDYELDGGKLVHFNTSADIAYFILQGYKTQQQIDDIMLKIIKNIVKKELIIIEKNGTYKNRFGVRKQKFRKRKITFKNLLLAYHNRNFDASKSVNPHFHFLLDRTARVGKYFMYLTRVLEDEAEEYQIKFNFMEERQEKSLTRYQEKAIKRISWLMNQGDMVEIDDYFRNKNQLNEVLDLLTSDYKDTQNISFFIKTLLAINMRLRELNIDYIYNDLNLKESIFFFLNDEQIVKLEKLRQGEVININMNNVLDREILKYAHGFKSDTMSVIVDKFDLKTVSKDKLLITNGMDANARNKKDSKDRGQGFRDLVIKDARNTLSYSKTDKDWKLLLLEMGYHNVAMKTSKLSSGQRENIGLNIITMKKTKMFIPFHQVGVNLKKIKKIFQHNIKKKRKPKKLKSYIENYKKTTIKDKHINLKKFEYEVEILLEIYSTEKKMMIDSSSHHDIYKKYNIEKSDMYNISTYTNNITTIVDYISRIQLKVSTNIHESIGDMVSLAKLKGWSVESLKISGTEQCVQKAKSIILREDLLHTPEDDIEEFVDPIMVRQF